MATPEWCDEHWMTLPCAGCRADALVNGAANDAQTVTDVRRLAGGDRDE